MTSGERDYLRDIIRRQAELLRRRELQPLVVTPSSIDDLRSVFALVPTLEVRRIVEHLETKMPPPPLSGEPGGDEGGG